MREYFWQMCEFETFYETFLESFVNQIKELSQTL